MLDQEFLFEQAEYYANIRFSEPDILASVHLENSDDIMFWNAQLQRVRPGRYNYVCHSKAHRDDIKDTSGREQCLRYVKFLSPYFFVCVDSDMHLLCGELNIDASHYVAQTYTYSWENHCCESKNLKKRMTNVSGTFDIEVFLAELSRVIYEPLRYLMYYSVADNKVWNIGKFRKCIPHQAKRSDLIDNGEKLINEISENFDKALAEITLPDFDKIFARKFGATKIDVSNAYLFMNGHSLYDLISYIGFLLYKGVDRRFDVDILQDVKSLADYSEIENVLTDLRTILSDNLG